MTASHSTGSLFEVSTVAVVIFVTLVLVVIGLGVGILAGTLGSGQAVPVLPARHAWQSSPSLETVTNVGVPGTVVLKRACSSASSS